MTRGFFKIPNDFIANTFCWAVFADIEQFCGILNKSVNFTID